MSTEALVCGQHVQHGYTRQLIIHIHSGTEQLSTRAYHPTHTQYGI